MTLEIEATALQKEKDAASEKRPDNMQNQVQNTWRSTFCETHTMFLAHNAQRTPLAYFVYTSCTYMYT